MLTKDQKESIKKHLNERVTYNTWERRMKIVKKSRESFSGGYFINATRSIWFAINERKGSSPSDHKKHDNERGKTLPPLEKEFSPHQKSLHQM